MKTFWRILNYLCSISNCFKKSTKRFKKITRSFVNFHPVLQIKKPKIKLSPKGYRWSVERKENYCSVLTSTKRHEFRRQIRRTLICRHYFVLPRNFDGCRPLPLWLQRFRSFLPCCLCSQMSDSFQSNFSLRTIRFRSNRVDHWQDQAPAIQFHGHNFMFQKN